MQGFMEKYQAIKTVKINLVSAVELSETVGLCTTLYRNPIQARNFGDAIENFTL